MQPLVTLKAINPSSSPQVTPLLPPSGHPPPLRSLLQITYRCCDGKTVIFLRLVINTLDNTQGTSVSSNVKPFILLRNTPNIDTNSNIYVIIR